MQINEWVIVMCTGPLVSPTFHYQAFVALLDAALSKKTDQNFSYFTSFLTNFEISFVGLSKNP